LVYDGNIDIRKELARGPSWSGRSLTQRCTKSTNVGFGARPKYDIGQPEELTVNLLKKIAYKS
jgi:hypothetical protein